MSCVCVCVCVCLSACACGCMHPHTHTDKHTHTHTHTQTHINHMCACECVCLYLCLHVCMDAGVQGGGSRDLQNISVSVSQKQNADYPSHEFFFLKLSLWVLHVVLRDRKWLNVSIFGALSNGKYSFHPPPPTLLSPHRMHDTQLNILSQLPLPPPCSPLIPFAQIVTENNLNYVMSPPPKGPLIWLGWVNESCHISCPISTRHVPYECGMSHMNAACPIWIWDMPHWHVSMSNLPLLKLGWVDGSCHLPMSHGLYQWGMSHVNESWPTFSWAVSHLNRSCSESMSHVPYQEFVFHINESCPISTSHVPYQQVTPSDIQCEWVMSRMNESALPQKRNPYWSCGERMRYATYHVAVNEWGKLRWVKEEVAVSEGGMPHIIVPHQKLLGDGLSTLITPFSLICTISSQPSVFWMSTRTAPGRISQVLPGCRVRHPQNSKKLFVRLCPTSTCHAQHE